MSPTPCPPGLYNSKLSRDLYALVKGLSAHDEFETMCSARVCIRAACQMNAPLAPFWTFALVYLRSTFG